MQYHETLAAHKVRYSQSRQYNQAACIPLTKTIALSLSSFWWKLRQHFFSPNLRVTNAIRFSTRFRDEFDRGNGFVVEGEGHNLITDGMRNVLAALLAGQGGYSGVQYWAVGSGDAGADPLSPPAPSPSDTKLAVETGRVPVTISFVDDFGEATTGNALSKHVKIQAVFDKGIATGQNSEFGLFGGNASGTAESGILLNRVTHPLKHKGSGDIRRITIIIDF